MPPVKKANDWGTFQSLEDAPYRLIVASSGLDKTGKNHFGFTAPGPIAGLYFDPGGIEGVAQKFKDKEIRLKQYRFNKHKMGRTEAIEVRDEFEEDYALALTKARTIQIDESELWMVYRWAEFDSDSDAPKEYAPLYARYRQLIQDAVDAGVNLQLIQKVKEKWENVTKTDRNGMTKEVGRPSGKMEAYGMKEVPYLVQVNIEHTWDKQNQFGVHILNCRQNMEIAGESFYNTSFPEIAQLVFPDSSESDWE